MTLPAHPSPPTARRASAEHGFTLLSVLVAMVVLAFGLLALGRFYVAMTSAATQNQNVAALSPLSNGFWGVVQSSPSMLTSLDGTYTSANISAAPSGLQPWLTMVTNDLPQATVAITTSPDAASGAACSVTTGCTVTVQINWTQGGTALGPTVGLSRSQTFFYQFGLS